MAKDSHRRQETEAEEVAGATVNEEYESVVTRATRACTRIFLAVVALWAAITILKAIWFSLLIVAAILALLAGVWQGFQRWRGR